MHKLIMKGTHPQPNLLVSCDLYDDRDEFNTSNNSMSIIFI